MRLSQMRIRLDWAHCRSLRLFPGTGGRRLDVPVKQRITIGELGVRNRKLRIEFHSAFQTFDRLTQTLRGPSSRVITSGGVELARFFILTSLGVRRGTQDLHPDRRTVRATFPFLRRHYGRPRLDRFADQRRMSQLLKNRFKLRLPT